MTAYRDHEYDAASERLEKALEWDPQDWNARLFLGMSCLKAHNYDHARSAFLFMYKHCPNHDLREKAWEALELIKAREAHPS
jgi:Flp pilus assembly protein TadD